MRHPERSGIAGYEKVAGFTFIVNVVLAQRESLVR
jgi:nickel-dependent lactate racemase